MPTIFSHAFVGVGAGLSLTQKRLPARFWVLSVVLPCLPDADVIGFAFGIPYEHFLGHRGFFHGIPFAFLLAAAVVAVFFRDTKSRKRKILLTVYFFLITASHGILDAFTDGGRGIALLSPFDNARYFFPWTPIEVSPIGIGAFFSEWGVRVLINESVWIWTPLVFWVASRRAWFRRRQDMPEF